MTTAEARARSHSSVQALEVRLGDTLVGALTHLGDEALIFTFDRTYMDASRDRPTLSLGFKAADGGLVEQTRPTRVRLPPFFSNLLPEAHLREYLATRGGIHPEREFFLMWLLGADLPGAIVVRSVDGTGPPTDDDDAPPRTHADEQPLRFSLAGVQLKFSALMETSQGLTLPVAGVGGDWIVKLPSPRFDAVPENEYAMMALAKAVGLDVPEVRLVATKDIGGLPDLPEAFGQSLAVRRFDRPRPSERVHIEDFAQVFGVYPENKYKKASYGSIARVLWLEAGEEAVTEYTRRLVFNVLIGNADAHLKNWSLMYPDRRTPKLAPAYDLVATVPYLPPDRLALSLADTKEFADIDLDRFRRFADKAGLPTRIVLRAARETADKLRDLWPTHEPLRMVPERIRKAMTTHLQTVPL